LKGADISMTINRDASRVAGYTATYTVPQTVYPNAATALNATFYAQAGVSGAVVGTATASAVASGTTVTFGSIALQGVIKKVTVTPATMIAGSAATQLTFSGTDAASNVVAVTPGSAIWAVTSGSAFITLTPDGIASPVAAGTAMVTSTVDGVTSAPVQIVVQPILNNGSFQIMWPARSRSGLTHSLSSALSVAVTLQGAGAGAANISTLIDRDPTKPGAYTGTYSFAQTIYPATLTTLNATFYAQPGETGAVVGTATAPVTANSTSVLLGTITLDGTIKKVTTAPATFAVGDAAALLFFTATDAASNVVAVTPGSAIWKVTSGGAFLTITPDGIATPVSAGTAQVTATVDGVTSAPLSIVVNPILKNGNFQISWPARSRALTNPLTSALSVSVVLKGGGAGGADVSTKIDRDSTKIGAYTGTYTFAQTIYPNSLTTLNATFYAQAGEQGAVVGTATGSVTANSTSVLLGTITLTGTITKVVALPATLTIGTTALLSFSCTDASDHVVAVSSGSAMWSISSGVSFLKLAKDGLATPLKAGTADVIATVDGITSAPAEVVVNSATLSAGPWTKFHADVRNTGYGGGAGATGTVKWHFGLGNAYAWSTPAIGSDGSLYIGTNSSFVAVNPDGTQKWVFSLGNIFLGSPAVATDGTVYAGAENGLFYAFTPTGSVKWSFKTNNGIQASPTIAADGTVYIGSYDGKLYALTPSGALKWSYNTGYPIFSCPAIGADGTIYVGAGTNKYLHALNPDGTVKWTFKNAGGDTAESPCIGSDGTIYINSNDGFLYAVNPDGSQKWACSVHGGDPGLHTSSPAIAPNGTIYVGSLDNNLYAVSSAGSVLWKFATGGLVQSSPAIGSDGTIYAASRDGNTYAVNPDGTKKWSVNTGSGPSSPSVGSDGTVYVAADSTSSLYAIK